MHTGTHGVIVNLLIIAIESCIEGKALSFAGTKLYLNLDSGFKLRVNKQQKLMILFLS